MAEEATRGSVDAVSAAAEIDTVEVELEDLVLREFPLQRNCEDSFLDLASERAAACEENVARKLLRDRRAALRPAAALNAGLHRARHSDGIDADMGAEALVFDRDHRGAHLRRDLVVRQPLAEAGPNVHEYGSVGGS